MSQAKRCCPYDCSLEELEELEAEFKRRRLETRRASATATCSTNCYLSIASAREILSQYLLPKHQLASRGEAFQSDHAIVLLRQHPTLATKSFSGRTVISFFLQHAGASTSVIQELCDLWKTTNPRHEDDDNWLSAGFDYMPNLVADACVYCSYHDTIKVVAEEFPDQTIEKRYNATPLELFLMRCCVAADPTDCEPPLDIHQANQIFQVMIECTQTMDPGADHIEDVVLGAYGDAFCDLFAKTLSKTTTKRSLSIEEQFKFWDEKAIHRANLFLPRLNSFKLAGIDADARLFQSTLNMFCEVKPALLKKLELPVFYEILHQTENHLFVKATQSCPNLEHLTLLPFQDDVSSTDAKDARALCMLCKDTLLGTDGLESFTVEVLPHTDGAALSELLCAVFVTVKSCDLTLALNPPRYDDSWVPFEIPPNSKLQSLALNSKLGAQTMIGILGNLCGLESLTKLQLSQDQRKVDINNELGALLTQNQLQSLQMWGCDGVSLQFITKALEEDSSMKTLWHYHSRESTESLENFANMMEHNVTLEDVMLGYPSEFEKDPYYSQVIYWVKCNMCGRGKLSDPSSRIDSLVVALETATREHPGEPDNLWYGLLRVNPGPWADAALAGFYIENHHLRPKFWRESLAAV
ncbi:expressed unknown protein [Seminavis robusta]|uniref:Uncharacterized protein n=1 Tax=Seminavis robusta TaxID=568900 RepID=A0A9N8EV11_9STRA|nr:expressed unknown protein [Seminavis robusta]|eukprot:Sro2062_g313070.1 n/a (640) ;mRNA; r:10899-12818